MRLGWIAALYTAGAAFAQLTPAVVPRYDTTFDLGELLDEIFEETLYPRDIYDLEPTPVQKRDFTSTVEGILGLVNSSDIVFGVLDQIAYNPTRISKLANFTAQKVGGIDIGSLANFTKNLDISIDINATAAYNEVMDSGVVASLLDGILLDSEFRPVLAKLIARLLEGNKNLLNYLIKNVFKGSKRDVIEKRSNGGTLETFVGNVISSVLSSQLVGNLASDVLVALNETQFLTTTAKKFIADEGYQNMTAQFVLDLFQSGSITLNAQSINITGIANKVLSKPQVLVSLVSNLLSGRVSIPSLGKYTAAVKDIMDQVESMGVFADLNQYIFSESNPVTTPLIATDQIVVPRTISTTSTPKTSSTKTTNSTTTKVTNSTTRRASATTSGVPSALSSELSSVSKLIFSFATSTKSSSKGASSTSSVVAAASESAAEVASILSELRGMSSDSSPSSSPTTASADASESSSDAGLLSIIQALGDSSSSNEKREVEIRSNSGNRARGKANKAGIQGLITVHVVVFAGLLII